MYDSFDGLNKAPRARIRFITVSNVLTAISLAVAVVALFVKDGVLIKSDAITAFFVFTTFIFILVASYFAWYDRARYSEVIMHTNYISRIAKEYVASGTCNNARASEKIQVVLTSLHVVMSMITRKNCSVSIKSYDPSDDTVSFRQISRDSKKKQTPERATFLAEQFSTFTAFTSENISPKCVVSQNVQRDFRNHAYKHPLLEGGSIPKKWNGLTGSYSDWPLPFSSTIVAPIGHNPHKDIEAISGFLCVNSVSRGVFRPKYDAEIVLFYANIIHTIFTVTSLTSSEGMND